MKPLASLVVLVLSGFVTAAGDGDDIFKAVGDNDPARVKKLLDADPKLASQKNAQGYTPLHAAAAGRNADVVKLLLDARADVNAKGDDDQTPLHSAAVNGGKEVVALLLERGAEVDAVTKTDRFTPLHRAAQRGHVPAMTLLLAKGASVDGGWNAKDLNPSITPLHFAVREGQFDAARLLLAKGGAVDATGRGAGTTPLAEAVDRGDRELVKFLLRKGADANRSSVLGRALQSGKMELIQPFVAKGADFKTAPQLLLSAVWSQKKEVVGLTLALGPEDIREDGRGISALVYASREGLADIVRLLLDKGVDPNLIGKEYTTPLNVAATKEIAELLLKHGAKIDEPDRQGQTALLAAVFRGNRPVAELLDAKGAKHTAETLAALDRAEELAALLKKDGLPKPAKVDRPTPLHAAAAFGQSKTARVLIDAGADANATREDGETPLHVAAARGHLAVVELLVEHKARVNAMVKLPSFSARARASHTPTMAALDGGHVEVVRFLAKSGGLPAVDGAKNAAALLPAAATLKHLGLVKFLIEAGAPADTKLPPNQGTALHLAAELGDLDMVKWLVARKLDVKAVDSQNWTPLMRAVPTGRTAVVEYLLSQGAKLDENALFRAASHGHAELVELLLAKGANRDAVSDFSQYTALGHAAGAGEIGVVKLLHEKASAKKDVGVLHEAAFRGHRAVAAFLLEKGVDVEEVRPDGFYLYYFAFHPRHVPLLRFFAETDPARFTKGLRTGVTIEEINDGKQFGVIGGRPLQAAVAGRQKDVAALLLEKGASAKVLFPDGSTLLHLAVTLGDDETAGLLLKHGVPVDTRNKAGRTALDIAVEREEDELAALVRRHGAGK